MATKKGGSSTSNGRTSNPKYLGVKKFGNQKVTKGNIIVRQRGTKFYAGPGTGIGKDHTIFADADGIVFYKKSYKDRTYIHVVEK